MTMIGVCRPVSASEASSSALTGRVTDPETFQAAVELMKLQLRHQGWRLEVQYASARIWSFPASGEVCRKDSWNQRVGPWSGLSRPGGLVYPYPQ